MGSPFSVVLNMVMGCAGGYLECQLCVLPGGGARVLCLSTSLCFECGAPNGSICAKISS